MSKKKILLTGINGQVGHALQSHLTCFDCVGMSRKKLDLTNAQMIRRVIQEIKPDIIINPAAYTAVDKAESEPELAYAINAIAPGVIAEEAKKLGAALIHFSTDYVYDGSKTTPYDEADEVNPISIYGKSKLAGEDAIRAVGIPHLILRTSWVYGAYGKNFLKTIVKLASEREELGIVADQFGAPTSDLSIAEGVAKLLLKWLPEKEYMTGIYHLTNTGRTSWHGFACEIVKQYNKRVSLKVAERNIKPLTTADYPTPARRPANSCLNNKKLKSTFDFVLPSWQEGLKDVIQTMGINQ
ncbi:MAG TPA: dTDP-4-dehydrorhamnose reductase [Methylophilaceae bacterium]|nr:dTDP-4-dehydrorhamnose reductase [Methylophilaceae bacterium]